MKKLIAILVVFALFASSAFAADVYFGAWGRGNFVPLRVVIDGATDTNKILSATEVGWGSVPSFGFEFSLDGGEIGFAGNISIADWGVGFNGNAHTWWKPIDALTLGIGWYRWEVLRGAGGSESFASYANGGSFGEENLFARFDTTGGPGAIIQLTPIENLYVGAAILTGPGQDGSPIADVFKGSQYALGYDIPGIGLARFGYFGDMGQALQVAFKLTAVDSLSLDFGFTYKTDETLADGKGNNIQVNLVGSFAISDAFSVWFGVNGLFGKKDAGDLQFGLNPTFSLGDIGDVGLGFYINLSFVKDSKPSLGFDLYLAKNVGGGSFKVGVAASITPSTIDPDKNDIVFAIPLEITY